MKKLRFKEFISDSNSIKYINLKDALLYTKSDDKEENSIKNKQDEYIYKLYSPKGHIGYSKLKVSDNKFIGLVKWGSGAGNTILCEAESSVVWTMGALIAKKNYSIKYFYYKLNYQFFHKFISTSTTPNLYYNDFSEELIQTPSYVEQEKIGGFLSAFDKLIEKQQEKIGLLKELKKGYLQKMFPKNDANVPEIRFKGFTETWEQCELREIIDVNSGRDYKHLKDGNIPVYGTGGYMLSVNEALSDNRNAVGIGRKGTIDKPFILKAPFWTVDTLFFVIPKEGNDLDFIYLVFQNINWKKYDESTGVPSLSKTTINSVSIKKPTLTEQRQIGSFLEKIDSLITLHHLKLDQLANLKKGYMQRLFA